MFAEYTQTAAVKLNCNISFFHYLLTPSSQAGKTRMREILLPFPHSFPFSPLLLPPPPLPFHPTSHFHPLPSLIVPFLLHSLHFPPPPLPSHPLHSTPFLSHPEAAPSNPARESGRALATNAFLWH